MKSPRRYPGIDSGYTFVEMIIVLFIILLLLIMGLYWYQNAKSTKTLQIQTDSVLFTLQKAKSNAISGKNGGSAGVKFNPDSYIYFNGNSFDAANPANASSSIDSMLTATTSIAGDTVIFARITGATYSTATVTVSYISDPGRNKSIVIGPLGDMRVVQ